ncbi:hypothetical protein F4818DRAFT_440065 [Hypoxylon cercidicola]|nr:hypothetical protein F4818DRAFT_440065 [Hypoxylon cercidicola]
MSYTQYLYLAIYYGGKWDSSYRYGFLIDPTTKDEQPSGLRCCVKHLPLRGWQYEEVSLEDIRTADILLARIVIAKVTDYQKLTTILQETPVRDNVDLGCNSWCKDVVDRIIQNKRAAGISSIKSWEKAEAAGLAFVCHKRLAGRYASDYTWLLPSPTYDALEKEEILP